MARRKDPLEAYRAQGIPDHPVGTLDEVIAHKLPTKVFGACYEESPDGTIRGCEQWAECTMSYKGLTAKEGGGPRNHCWERIKSAGNGGGIVRNVQPCYWGVAQQENVMLNKEVLRVIADEGEEYEALTTVPDPAGGRDNLGFFKWDEKLLKFTVPPFERLGQQQKLARHELRASIIERDQKKVREDHAARTLGITGAETPLDKRGRGKVQSPESKG